MDETLRIVSDSQKTASGIVAAGMMRGRRMGSYCLMGTELQFCKMKRVLELDGGDGCTVM